jgi:hypothetical protein
VNRHGDADHGEAVNQLGHGRSNLPRILPLVALFLVSCGGRSARLAATDLSTSLMTTRPPMADASKRPSAILSRVPWKLPVARKGEGIYIDLLDGRRLIDGVGMIAPSAVRWWSKSEL